MHVRKCLRYLQIERKTSSRAEKQTNCLIDLFLQTFSFGCFDKRLMCSFSEAVKDFSPLHLPHRLKNNNQFMENLEQCFIIDARWSTRSAVIARIAAKRATIVRFRVCYGFTTLMLTLKQTKQAQKSQIKCRKSEAHLKDNKQRSFVVGNFKIETEKSTLRRHARVT